MVDIFDAITGRWTSTSSGAGSLSVARSSLAAAGAGDKIVFAGGRCDCKGLYSFHDSPSNYSGGLVTVDIYDVTTGVTSPLANGTPLQLVQVP